MAPFLEQTDRGVRQAAWELSARRRLQDKDTLDDLFDQMMALRIEVAREAGFSSYVDSPIGSASGSITASMTPTSFTAAVEQVVVPLARKIQQEAQHRRLACRSLRPWDTAVDPLGRPPLKPLKMSSGWPRGPRRSSARSIRSWGPVCLHAVPGIARSGQSQRQAPGGYQTTFEDERLPFIFMNAVGLDGDVRTLLHEGGHAFHTLACRGEPLAAYRESPLEFCEVASMTMELFGGATSIHFTTRQRPTVPIASCWKGSC